VGASVFTNPGAIITSPALESKLRTRGLSKLYQSYTHRRATGRCFRRSRTPMKLLSVIRFPAALALMRKKPAPSHKVPATSVLAPQFTLFGAPIVARGRATNAPDGNNTEVRP